MPAGAREEIAASVERTLLEEARRNELTVAYVRAVTLLLVMLLDVFAYHYPMVAVGLPEHSITIPLLSGGWFVVSLGIAIALRRGRYRPELRIALPLMDGLLVFLLFANFLRTMGPEHFLRIGQLTAAGVTCALIAASGSLRLTRSAAVATTAFAIGAFAGISHLAIAWSAQVVLGLIVLVGTGLLSVRMTKVVERAVQSEIGRTTLARFLPDTVISRAYQTPLELVTEPKSGEATILVSDLRGFTAMSEKLDPVVVLELLNEVQGAFAAAVRSNGGIVDKFMGDGMLAVYRSVESSKRGAEEHARHALATTRAMADALAPINEAWAERGLGPIRFGVGIHSGPVVTGCLGSGARLEFTVIGDTVNTTSRLEALTKEMGVTVLVSAETARRLGEDEGDLEPMGEVTIRGRQAPLRVLTLREG
ncbi:MAG: adenylate/guanylate cyclase domain-containing protein [Deltaproteobacteria bacterium]|jgi:class 3 adenylate cyclase|nr:adenylate/guanylate cyclase domain-containing protein [Deltaproteobacteria bacterium]MBW2532470.1 adenylate/guanylate cyclase domain-containing protein [Deltaproteobacteria bacterium]